ncbi:MAG TPA: glycosyltransferase family 1 protein [Candidatus Corynebacterium avicola]|uniref:Glycosyltransferase family 1 protein n=1 Tax=Candidatus Corynebacterium avicola TaxID=2838527 RepID=A0A9D1UKM7_9CORY|nr:glycosyltransferase family 1 protein [Candidatus Corynebacterium avicola]
MRVLIVAESFLPIVNGVVNSVLRVLEHLRTTGDDALVIAPAGVKGQDSVHEYEGFPVVHVPALSLPVVDSLPVGVPSRKVLTVMRDYQPDVVHLASPFVLGAAGTVAARKLGIPTVAVYQTDVPGFAASYKLGPLTSVAWSMVRAIHNRAALTLAPSSATIAELEERGVERIRHWGRGVDAERFNPGHRNEELRRSWLGEHSVDSVDPASGTAGRRIVGYIGRLASEKHVERLRSLVGNPGIQLVVVGDGPERGKLEKLLPEAVFTGELRGAALSEAYASLDIFVHTGEFETFCQSLQEALASGVPSVAPNAGGPVDLIDHGVTGELLEVDRFESELPAAIGRLTSDDHIDFRERAREGVLPRTWPGLCDALLGHYRDAVGEPRHERKDAASVPAS